ncbi:MAG: carbamoyltransferase C-terminal domain-containing protein [Erythrobacter sp.]|uniref:carbamoyltransferase C-terminal domain-containing protein n=1 Tax=Erythrobacter sp. TaxID=1042 RepID=UPI003267A48E
MKILSYNPGHDGAVVSLIDGRLELSIEAEKDSNYRYSSISGSNVLQAIGELHDIPDVICMGGWWPRDHHESVVGSTNHVNYRGIGDEDIIVGERRFLQKATRYFSSSHERSHILCAFGMSSVPVGTPCYALVWEGELGAFYEIDEVSNIRLIADVLDEPGNRYGQLYGLADPTFPKDWKHARLSDAGKLMALASFSTRSTPTAEESKLLEFLLDPSYQGLGSHEDITGVPHYNAGFDDPEFRNFAGIYSDALFEKFHRFAKETLKPNRPLVIAGGCGLNCDWNTKWKQTGLFSDVFVPPVANDSGSAIGTAIDAQLYFSGNPKVEWDVYSGLLFQPNGTFEADRYDVCDLEFAEIAELLENDLILGWVSGRYEIGPRALGNRSILASPFHDSTRERLNEIKQREQFRPIAPICLMEDAARLFGCHQESPHMLYTYKATTDALAAVTHVNGTARIQTVTPSSNQNLHDLLTAFKARTGYGVLCNTSLNFNGKGLINNIADLDAYAVRHGLDGFIIDGRAHLLKESKRYQAYLETASISAPCFGADDRSLRT